MKQVLFMVLFATAIAAAFLIWRGLRKWKEREKAEEARAASFMAEALKARAAVNADAPKLATPPAAGVAVPAAAPAAQAARPALAPKPAAAPKLAEPLAMQKLLFEAALKAGEAGEPEFSIQLYGRLLTRYPESQFANLARASIETQKKKLKTQVPG